MSVWWITVGLRTSVLAGTSVESAMVTSATSLVAVVPFVMGVGSVSATCGTASDVGSVMMCFRIRE